jgi:protein involved in ribonucleotide reduction
VVVWINVYQNSSTGVITYTAKGQMYQNNVTLLYSSFQKETKINQSVYVACGNNNFLVTYSIINSLYSTNYAVQKLYTFTDPSTKDHKLK